MKRPKPRPRGPPLRQDCFREGRYWDTLFMAILRDEWKKPD